MESHSDPILSESHIKYQSYKPTKKIDYSLNRDTPIYEYYHLDNKDFIKLRERKTYNIPSMSTINNNNNNNIIDDENFESPSKSLMGVYTSMKTLSLSHLTANQHFFMALCRDVSLLPPLFNIFKSLKKAWQLLYSDQSLYFNNIPYNNNNVTAATTAHINNTGDILKNSTTNILIQSLTNLTHATASEYLLCSLWSLVSLYLTYATLDSLMIRWIVKYSTVAAIVRMFSMSLLIITVESLVINSFSLHSDYLLHVWIIISCFLTVMFIWQSYLSSNLNYVNEKASKSSLDSSSDYQSSDSSSINSNSRHSDISSNTRSSSTGKKEKSKFRRKHDYPIFLATNKRTIDLYKITVFCVVPVGVASFLTMVGLLRNLFIQRIDVEELTFLLHKAIAEE